MISSYPWTLCKSAYTGRTIHLYAGTGKLICTFATPDEPDEENARMASLAPEMHGELRKIYHATLAGTRIEISPYGETAWRIHKLLNRYKELL